MTQEIVINLKSVQMNVPASEVEEEIDQCDKYCGTSEELNEDQIIAAVFENIDKETMNKDSDGDADESLTRFLHTNAKNAFDIAFQYIEQNSASIPMEI